MRVAIGQGSCGIASGAKKVEKRMKDVIAADNLDIPVGLTGCIGACYLEPIVDVYDDDGNLTRYVHVDEEKAEDIVEIHLKAGDPIKKYMIPESGKHFLEGQTRIALANCGIINPEDIDDYIAAGGYKALEKALHKMTADEICETVLNSDLRGRGGAGFPTGKKWTQVKNMKDHVKYVVCNADEGDPGAFMDRSVMEGDPHKMLEGMIIAAIATGAHEAYIYVRAEYPLAVSRLRTAIAQAEERGFLGDNIMGSGFDLTIHINLGAGAFVCGEGSALTASIEGKRGMPRVKPPRTTEKGLFERPTVLNNVETYANVSYIINNGAEAYKAIGTPKNAGTKAFALTGKVKNTGLVEVPMGTTLREVIFGLGGGIKDGKKFKAVQIGGPSGGCLTEEHLDLPMDFDSLKKAGAMIGSGGLVVMDEDTCMVSIAQFFMNFTANESCGKCVPCREGTHIMLEMLDDIVENRANEDTVTTLLDLADTIKATALCGLGKTAPNPVVSTITHFKDEYMAHVRDGVCPTGQCQAYKHIIIDDDKCVGCGLCKKACPANAISGGSYKKAHVIDNDKCIKCMACIGNCKFDAILVE
ncbi:MAG: NADH-ubiquinone oxidoreductase-F iron-sulfur binding region domain-containing protein [Anaerovoracaceae bacterium]|jgi:NADH-quinone oxidoreductase subunit F